MAQLPKKPRKCCTEIKPVLNFLQVLEMLLLQRPDVRGPPGPRAHRPLCRPQGKLYFCATFAWFLGQFSHLEIYFLSTLRQMPQTITNIPRCLPQILTLPKFWYHLAHSFSRKNVPFDFERAFWEAEGALPKPKGPGFQENECDKWYQNSRTGKICGRQGGIFVIVCGICGGPFIFFQ